MNFLAFDLGGSSGKLFLITANQHKLKISCIHQFKNAPVSINGGLYWDFIHIYDELCTGLRKAVLQTRDNIDSIGFDSFCNDFALIDQKGNLLTPIRCYRDERTARCQEHTYSVMSKGELYTATGNQNALFNTLLQLDAMNCEGQGWLLDQCYHALFLSDLLIYLLTDRLVTEYTTASVSQLYDMIKGDWSDIIYKKYGLRRSLFPPVVMPGINLGNTTEKFDRQIGSHGFSVTTVCQHDTASAFLASVCTEPAAIISCGTWCLVGTEHSAPIISDIAFSGNIANEGGYPGHHRLLRNVMGTWIIQEILRERIAAGESITYAELDEMAAAHTCTEYFIDADNDMFYQPGHMEEKVKSFCRKSYGKEPSDLSETIFCVYTSLVFKYRYSIEKLEELTGHRLPVINVVGGGSKSRLMCQLTADICGRQVLAGPDDATALGNAMVQMLAHGCISTVNEGRKLIQKNVSIQTYEPMPDRNWDVLYQQYIEKFYPKG